MLARQSQLKEFSGEVDSIPESNFKQLRNEDVRNKD
jgi:hypothetical protein